MYKHKLCGNLLNWFCNSTNVNIFFSYKLFIHIYNVWNRKILWIFYIPFWSVNFKYIYYTLNTYVNILIWSVTNRGISTQTFMIAAVKRIAIDTGGIVVALQWNANNAALFSVHTTYFVSTRLPASVTGTVLIKEIFFILIHK